MSITVAIPSIPPRADLLAMALASVTQQTRAPDAVVIAVDNHHEGAAATRNRALAAVETDWVAFLDDDDMLLPQHLAVLEAVAHETGADLVYPWFKAQGGEDPLGWFGKDFDPVALREANYIPVTTLVRTKLAKEVGGFPKPQSEEWAHEICEDWGFLLRLVDAGATFVHHPEITWVWRHHRMNTSGRTWRAS